MTGLDPVKVGRKGGIVLVFDARGSDIFDLIPLAGGKLERVLTGSAMMIWVSAGLVLELGGLKLSRLSRDR